jgi:hypothetical protein
MSCLASMSYNAAPRLFAIYTPTGPCSLQRSPALPQLPSAHVLRQPLSASRPASFYASASAGRVDARRAFFAVT